MPDGGILTLTTEPVRIEQGDDELSPGDYIRIAVTDTGTGMPPEVIARAFDPFFTTKPPGKGTGLGLSQVYGIAKQSGGTASLCSKPGQGTTVNILLPSIEGGAIPDLSSEPDRIGGSHEETVLVIDDDPDVRGLVTGFLSDLGYDVLEAEHGEAGLAILARLTPHLLIVDYAMPGMNGAEIARATRERVPELPILFLSGYADTAALESAVGKAPILRKPFRPSELAAAVRAVLDGLPLL
jgi:CheY-like chemotaxis protein